MCLSIKEALQKAASFLHLKEVENSRTEAEILLAFLVQKERIYFYSHAEEELSRETWDAYRSLVERRGAREPLAYLTGEKEFMGITFSINEGVLIPRPETEHLVEAVLYWVDSHIERKEKELQIIDLGTGCGNIALSLLVFLPSSRVTGIDIEEKAVALTRHNAVRLGVDKRLKLYRGKYWEDLEEQDFRFHVIVSNPPYIPTSSLSFLSAEVCREPRSALDGGEDGLRAYREIFSRVSSYLCSPGLLALEVGMGQAKAVCQMAEFIPGFFQKKEIRKDYAGIERLVLFERGTPDGL